MLVDTHCHIHESSYPLDITDVLKRAQLADVGTMLCVGTSEQSSREAVELSAQYPHLYASVGVHPHDTKDGWQDIEKLLRENFNVGKNEKNGRVVAIGEVGLDYYYTHSPREVQIEALEAHLQLATNYNLPVIFHVREAFHDFWPILDNFQGIRGVLHSFTDTQQNLQEGLRRELFVGVNGISTFTKDTQQQELFATIPIQKLVLETDAPFLTPVPFRGKVNEPAFVRNVAEHHAFIRKMTFEELSAATTTNAQALFAF